MGHEICKSAFPIVPNNMYLVSIGTVCTPNTQHSDKNNLLLPYSYVYTCNARRQVNICPYTYKYVLLCGRLIGKTGKAAYIRYSMGVILQSTVCGLCCGPGVTQV